MLDFQFYPNPTNGILVVETPYLNEEFKLIIYDLLGRNIYSMSITTSSTTIDIGNLPDGVYIIKLTHNSSSISKKVIVQH